MPSTTFISVPLIMFGPSFVASSAGPILPCGVIRLLGVTGVAGDGWDLRFVVSGIQTLVCPCLTCFLVKIMGDRGIH